MWSTMRLTTQRRSILRRWCRYSAGAVIWVVAVLGCSGCIVPDLEYCAVNADCARLAVTGGPNYICDPSLHSCVKAEPGMCFRDEDCTTLDSPRCDVASKRCMPCVVGDVNDTSCARFSQAPFCANSPGGGTACVACLQNLDCPESTPICSAQRCRKCQTHTDCEGKLKCHDGNPCTDSLVCISDGDFDPPGSASGRCAQNGRAGPTVYVYGDPAVCSDSDGRTGTDVDKPFCKILTAYNAAKTDGRRYIRVLPYSTPYMQLATAVTDGHYVFIGSGLKSRVNAKQATVTSMGATFSVSDNGNVTIDDFDLYEITPAPNGTLINCNGNRATKAVPTLTLKYSTLRGITTSNSPSFAGAAVDLYNCKAKVYGNVIGLSTKTDLMANNPFSHANGMKITSDSELATSYLIENNVIAGNWGMAVDLDAVANPTVTFRFNTIVGNGLKKLFGGIRCPPNGAGVVPLSDLIVVGNYPNTDQSQFIGNCGYTRVVVGSAEPQNANGTIRLDPEFEDDFSLKDTAANRSCCIDQSLPSATESFPAFDIARTPRPQGLNQRWDIGAFELKLVP